MQPEPILQFKTLCVIQFSSNSHPDAVDWVKKRITAPKDEGGGGLEVAAYITVQMHTTLHIGASYQRLLEAAEDMNLKKACVDGSLRHFCRSAADRLYDNFGSEDLFFTVAEKQRIVLHELENIRALSDEPLVPGYPSARLFVGQSIVRKCLSEKIVEQVFPLHDVHQISLFDNTWSYFRVQPIEMIRNYLGEKIGFYCAFIRFYTLALAAPAVFAFLYHLLNWGSRLPMIIVMALVNVFWPIIFLNLWRRRSSELAYRWGTTNIKVTEQPRSAFYGDVGISPVTGKPCLLYPTWKRNLGICTSWLVVLFCLLLAYAAFRFYALAHEVTRAWYRNLSYEEQQRSLYGFVAALPNLIYSAVVVVANKTYKSVAVRLTDWENHCLQHSYENHLILKLVLFFFTNTFVVMFYSLYIRLDDVQLRNSLINQLVFIQIIDRLWNTLMPCVMYFWRKWQCKQAGDINAQCVTPDGRHLPARSQAELEAMKTVYEGTFDDYHKLVFQFGYVTFFSFIFPRAGICALINNIVEILTYAFKLCKIYQRPFAEQAFSIGVWQFVFESMVVLSVIANCTFIGMTFHFGIAFGQLPAYCDDFWLLFYVVMAEHVLLGLKLLLSYVIPDVPYRVAVSLARDEYQSKMAAIVLINQDRIKKSM